jgi:hypothetical protein
MKRFTIVFSALLYVGVSLHTSANANEYPDLNMQGTVYSNSCNVNQKQILADQVKKIRLLAPCEP